MGTELIEWADEDGIVWTIGVDDELRCAHRVTVAVTGLPSRAHETFELAGLLRDAWRALGVAAEARLVQLAPEG